MKIMLCFGTFCHILLLFSNGQIINQGTLVSRIVSTIDPNNRILFTDKDSDFDDEIQKLNSKATGHNSPEISKILSGNNVLKLIKPDTVPCSKSMELFDNFISLWFSADERVQIILVLLQIIKDDTYIDEHKEMFYDFFGMNKEDFLNKDKYNFNELLFNTLRYTMLGNIDISEQKRIVKQINNDIVRSCKKKSEKYNINNVNILTQCINKIISEYSKKDYVWNPEKQELTIIKRKMSCKSNIAIQKEEYQSNELEDYNIKALIDRKSFDTIPSYCIEDAIHLYGCIKNNSLRSGTKYDEFANILLEFLKFLRENCTNPDTFMYDFSLKAEHDDDFETKCSCFTRRLNDLYYQIEKDIESEADNLNNELRAEAKSPGRDPNKF